MEARRNWEARPLEVLEHANDHKGVGNFRDRPSGVRRQEGEGNLCTSSNRVESIPHGKSKDKAGIQDGGRSG